MTWYYAQGLNEWKEWKTVTLNYQLKLDCQVALSEFKKAHRGKYKRYRIKSFTI